MNLFFYSLSAASFLFVWNHTFFLSEYYKLLGLKGWKLMDTFLEKSKDGYFMEFPVYLGQIRGKDRLYSWLYSLLSCPFCFSFFLNVPMIFGGIFYMGTSYFLTILGYLILRNLNKE